MAKQNTLTILDKAKALVYGDRNKSYGHPSDNFGTIAEMWNAYLTRRAESNGLTQELKLTAKDVAHLMGIMKYARLAHDPNHSDSLIDIAGYAATAERCDE